ncbi:MAG TPA: hypothetical protein VIL21_06165, partial [Solirubrobacterales bacterium]
ESSGEAATLKAWVDPNGQSTTYQFEYGTSSGAYGTTAPIPAESAGSEMSGKYVAYKITGLTSGETYYWRAVASNAGGKATGSQLSFTSSGAPDFDYLSVSDIAKTGATLNLAFGAPHIGGKVYFEYGTTTSYGSTTPTKEISSSEEEAWLSQPISGLKANTLYHYRAVGKNFFGTHVGEDQTFTTLAPVTLYFWTSEQQIKTGTQIQLQSGELTFDTGSSGYICNETTFSGQVTENPGALQALSTMKFEHEGEAKCPVPGPEPWSHVLSVTEGVTLDYAKNGSEEGIAGTSEFVLHDAVYYSGFKEWDCEFSLALKGSFKLASSLKLWLEGVGKYVGGPGICALLTPYAYGEFYATGEGEAVEAKP